MSLLPVTFHYGLCHMNIQEVPRVLPNSLKGWGVCYQVYVIGAHKRTHVDYRNMPNHCTSIHHEWMYEWQHWRRLLLGILHRVWCRPVFSPGSWSGRGWLPLILVWHTTVVGLSCSYCEAHLKRTTNPSCGTLYKSLIIFYYAEDLKQRILDSNSKGSYFPDYVVVLMNKFLSGQGIIEEEFQTITYHLPAEDVDDSTITYHLPAEDVDDSKT